MFPDLQPYDDNAYDSDPGQFEDAVENITENATAATTAALQPSAADKARAALAIQDARTQLQLRKKRKRVSQHGIEYPPIPSAFVKKVAQTALQSSGLSNTRVSADTLVALTQASEWFFEQLGDDLGAYAAHAKRKTIEDSDVATLMRRYVINFLSRNGYLFFLWICYRFSDPFPVCTDNARLAQHQPCSPWRRSTFRGNCYRS